MRKDLLFSLLLILFSFSCSNSDSQLSPEENKMLNAFNSQNYEEAIRLADILHNEEPNNPKPLVIKGRSQNGLGRFEEAIQSLDKAITIEPNFSDAYLYRALVYYALEDYEKGKKDWLLLLKKEPANPLYLEFYAHNRYRAKDFSEAIATYQKLIEKYPNKIDLYIYSAGAKREALDYDAAIIDLQNALKIDSKSSFANEELGNVFSSQEKYELAIEQFNLGLKYMSEEEIPAIRANIHDSRGEAFLKIGKVELATKDFDTSIQISPNAAAYKNKALIALQNKNIAQACEYLKRAQKYDASTKTAAKIQELVTAHCL